MQVKATTGVWQIKGELTKYETAIELVNKGFFMFINLALIFLALINQT